MQGEPSEDPIVSVVLPTYRRPAMLERAIDSVIAQTHAHWELLVVDDNGRGTPDQVDTERFMQRFGADPRVRYLVQERNRGAPAARNTGIGAARGRFVAFLDDDDVWYPTKLERQLERFDAAVPDLVLVYGAFRQVDEHGRGRIIWPDGRAHSWRQLLMRNGIGTTSLVLCRRQVLLDIGGFDERLPAMQDFDLYLRMVQRGSFDWVDEPLLDKHHHGGATIGKDLEGVLRANELFYEKHVALFEGDREVHHRRLRWFAEQAMHAGHMQRARGLFWRAWRQWPRAFSTLLLALFVSRPSVATYRWLRRRRRRPAAVGATSDAGDATRRA